MKPASFVGVKVIRFVSLHPWKECAAITALDVQCGNRGADHVRKKFPQRK